MRSAKYVSELLDDAVGGFHARLGNRRADAGEAGDLEGQGEVRQVSRRTRKAESVKFAAAAGNGLDALRAAIGPMGRACNNCHDDFQNKDLSK